MCAYLTGIELALLLREKVNGIHDGHNGSTDGNGDRNDQNGAKDLAAAFTCTLGIGLHTL